MNLNHCEAVVSSILGRRLFLAAASREHGTVTELTRLSVLNGAVHVDIEIGSTISYGLIVVGYQSAKD